VVLVAAAACGGGGGSADDADRGAGGDGQEEGAPNEERGSSTTAPAGETTSPPTTADPSGCTHSATAAKAPAGPSAQTVVLREADANGPRVDAVVYPRPDHEGRPWSQWGQGLVLPDGRVLSAIGDHQGRDGNSYLYVFDPGTGRLTQFADVLSNLPHRPGEWGYGKIHAQMVSGPCGDVYVATYWGTRDGMSLSANYRGDVLFRLDPATLKLESLGTPIEGHGLPSLATYAPDGVLYGEAVDPARSDPETIGERGAFFVYDTRRDEMTFRSDDDRHVQFRSVLVDGDGTAYLADDSGHLLVYEPGAGELAEHPVPLPGGGMLRAATAPAADGTVYGATSGPDQLFALRPDGQVSDLGSLPSYTTSLALHPDGSRFFFVPGAHGDSPELGTPLVAVDTRTGQRSTLVELAGLAEEQLSLTLGGTYNVTVDPSGERVYVGFNAGASRDDPWGEIVLVVVHLA
jgi:hypothetical protein